MPGHNDWYTLRHNPDDFHIALNPYLFYAMSVAEAADHTARIIHSKYPTLWLAMSGGLDSEFVADTLLRNRIPFTPVIVQDPINVEHIYARHWCRTNRVQPKLLEDLLANTKRIAVLETMARRQNNPSTIANLNIVLARMAERQGAALITGNGECFNDEIYPIPMGDNAEFYERDWLLESKSINHPGAFLSYTPELMHALVSNIDCSLPTQEAKSRLYNIPFRPKIQSSIGLTDVTARKIIHSYGKMRDLIALLEQHIIS